MLVVGSKISPQAPAFCARLSPCTPESYLQSNRRFKLQFTVLELCEMWTHPWASKTRCLFQVRLKFRRRQLALPNVVFNAVICCLSRSTTVPPTVCCLTAKSHSHASFQRKAQSSARSCVEIWTHMLLKQSCRAFAIEAEFRGCGTCRRSGTTRSPLLSRAKDTEHRHARACCDKLLQEKLLAHAGRAAVNHARMSLHVLRALLQLLHICCCKSGFC